MLKKNDIIELTVTGMTYEGLGVARYNDEQLKDFVIFIHNAVVGDVISARIVKILKRYAYAILEMIITPSDDRTEPQCSSFPKCGGCSFLNVNYETELKYKYDFVNSAFKKYHLEGIEPTAVVPSPQNINYRNKVQYPVGRNGRFGFYARQSHRVIPIGDCVLQDNDFSNIVKIVEDYISTYAVSCYNEETGEGLIRHLYIRKAPKTGKIMVCLVINGKTIPHKEQFTTLISAYSHVVSIYLNINTRFDNVILGRECILLWGNPEIEDFLNGLTFKISPLSFYQINGPQAEQIYKHIAENMGLTANDIVLDLYCGIGTIALSVAHKVKKVLGIEIIEEAVANAGENAAINNIKNALFYISDASYTQSIINDLPQNERPNVVIVDPPRKGLTDETIEAIKILAPDKIIYISCNPSTQAHDIALLNGTACEYTSTELIESQPSSVLKYEIKSITPFDMFPRTPHVETVVLMSRVEKDVN